MWRCGNFGTGHDEDMDSFSNWTQSDPCKSGEEDLFCTVVLIFTLIPTNMDLFMLDQLK